MTEKQYRKQWLKWHSQYEKIVYKILINNFKDIANDIPFNLLTKDNYNVLIRNTVNDDRMISLYYDFYKEIGIIHAKRVGKEVNKQIKEFTLNGFLNIFERDLLSWLFSNSLTRIQSVKGTYVAYLQGLITTGIAENKTISEITTDIQKLLKSKGFYRWQSLRIARTETTASANYASTKVAESSNLVYQKVWLSTKDSRTRRMPKAEFNHVAMNGVAVEENEKFEVPSELGTEMIDFAGDPKGSAGNIINCRCANVLRPKRDENGRFIRR